MTFPLCFSYVINVHSLNVLALERFSYSNCGRIFRHFVSNNSGYYRLKMDKLLKNLQFIPLKIISISRKLRKKVRDNNNDANLNISNKMFSIRQ